PFLRLTDLPLFAEMMHSRCEQAPSQYRLLSHYSLTGVSMIADLWHAPSAKEAVGTATTGSSEAIHLGGLAMKKLWQKARKAAGKGIYEPGYVSHCSSFFLKVN